MIVQMMFLADNKYILFLFSGVIVEKPVRTDRRISWAEVKGEPCSPEPGSTVEDELSSFS